MKKIFLLIIFSLTCAQANADDYLKEKRTNIVRDLVEEYEDILSKENLSTFFQPKFSNYLVVDALDNYAYQSSDKKNEYNDTLATGRLLSSFNFNKKLAINSQLTFDRVNNSDHNQRRQNSASGGGDRSFEDEGIFIRELNVSYDTKKYAILAGKFNLDFGTAWNWNRGIWTYEIANNYRQTEKLGIGGIYRLGDAKKTGEYIFGFSSFMNDRKNLDNSLITKRDSNQKSDATPGDYRLLSSYVTSLDIKFDFDKREKLSYHFAYINLAVNQKMSTVIPQNIADQKGFVAGMNYKYPLSKSIGLDSLIEYVSMKNVGGNSNVSDNYFTANIIGRLNKNWNSTLGYSKQSRLQFAQNGYDQDLSEVSFGYEFDKNSFFDSFIVQVGYKNLRTNYKTSFDETNSLGVLARYAKGF